MREHHVALSFLITVKNDGGKENDEIDSKKRQNRDEDDKAQRQDDIRKERQNDKIERLFHIRSTLAAPVRVFHVICTVSKRQTNRDDYNNKKIKSRENHSNNTATRLRHVSQSGGVYLTYLSKPKFVDMPLTPIIMQESLD